MKKFSSCEDFEKFMIWLALKQDPELMNDDNCLNIFFDGDDDRMRAAIVECCSRGFITPKE